MRQKSWMGWMELIVGILLLAGGIYTLMRPGNSLVGISFLYGCLAVFTGALDILFYVNMERRTGFSPVLALVTGILDIIAGVILLFQPAVGAWVLVWVFPIWFIAHCISQLAHLSVIRMISGSAYYYFSLAGQSFSDYGFSTLYDRLLPDLPWNRWNCSGPGHFCEPSIR